MKVKLLAFLAATLALGGAIAYMALLEPQTMTPVPETAESGAAFARFPDIALVTREGQTLHIDRLQEKIVLIHFWAAWCAPCHAEFPELVKAVAAARGKVALVAISLDDDYADSERALNAIAAKSHLSLRAPHLYWLWDEDKSLSLRNFNTVKVPETIIVKDGSMTDKIVGPGAWADLSAKW